MTKNDLIAKVQEALKVYSRKDAAYAVNIIFDSMVEALKRGERIEIRGFGNMTVRERKSRLGRNPKSGQAVKLESRKTPFFKTGKELRLKVDGK
ncbi:MAG: integration host factor subunit beta [Deltaproteobacteria bacterium HGW-Deltaproteobacteria-12]|jgi:integration host factor subunit beta|nr:MAG: integration host factor subunit beta [Deltaproteobacteria bacterium HGW-Deltaproteobacteria-12]